MINSRNFAVTPDDDPNRKVVTAYHVPLLELANSDSKEGMPIHLHWEVGRWVMTHSLDRLAFLLFLLLLYHHPTLRIHYTLCFVLTKEITSTGAVSCLEFLQGVV